jgi:hypothetical protein
MGTGARSGVQADVAHRRSSIELRRSLRLGRSFKLRRSIELQCSFKLRRSIKLWRSIGAASSSGAASRLRPPGGMNPRGRVAGKVRQMSDDLANEVRISRSAPSLARACVRCSNARCTPRAARPTGTAQAFSYPFRLAETSRGRSPRTPQKLGPEIPLDRASQTVRFSSKRCAPRAPQQWALGRLAGANHLRTPCSRQGCRFERRP